MSQVSKYLRIWLRLLPLAGLLIVVGFAFDSPFTESKALPTEVRIVDTSPPIVMGKCNPCHIDLSAFKNPNLVNFNHPVHFKRGIRCESCHTEWPHQQSRIIKPTMDVCMNCHGLSHGSQGVAAPGKCALCHPATFNLVPADHTPIFKASTHKVEAIKQANQTCLMCHKPSDCQSCHERLGAPTLNEENLRRYPVWRQPASERAKRIEIGGDKVEMSRCNFCHTNLQLWKNEKLVGFNHPVHFKRGIKCDSCHPSFPHRPGSIDKPKMTACFKCHSLEHGAQKTAAPGDCKLCHPATMQLKPAFHTPEFVGGAHKDWAKNDRSLCRMCHQQSFCDNCHRTEIPHQTGWKYVHGREASSPAARLADGSLTCFRCHKPEGPTQAYQKAPSCAKCHKAVVYPHQQPWAPAHGKTAVQVGKAVCTTCHVKKVFCDKCHGGIEMPHKEGWFGQHRRFLQDKPISICMACHQKTQCLLCHRTHKVHNQKEIYDFSELKR